MHRWYSPLASRPKAAERLLRDPELAFWVLNNHWDVNFAATQAGRIPARFHILPQSMPDTGAARAIADIACNPPVVVRTYDGVLQVPVSLIECRDRPA